MTLPEEASETFFDIDFERKENSRYYHLFQTKFNCIRIFIFLCVYVSFIY